MKYRYAFSAKKHTKRNKIKEVKPDTAEHITYKLNRNRQHNNRETWSFAGSLSDPL